MLDGEIQTLADLLGSGWHRAGTSLQMSCPNAPYSAGHKGVDSHFSFGIKAADGPSVCHCFACQIGGTVLEVFSRLFAQCRVSKDVFAYVQEVERFDLKGVIERLARRRNRVAQVRGPGTFNLLEFTKTCHSQWTQASKFLMVRGVTEEEVKRYRIGFDEVRSRVTFPFFSKDGDCVACTGRMVGDGQPKYWRYPTTNEAVLFGEEQVDNSLQQVVLVEGPFDCIRVRRLLPNVLALNSLNLSSRQCERLLEFANTVYLMLDGDDAGKLGIEKIGSALRRRVRVFVLDVLDGIDPDQMTDAQIWASYKSAKIFHY
jgi:DNA primase